jgi:uncharacterized protein with NAD-binding domain and iron-sulfur cluster
VAAKKKIVILGTGCGSMSAAWGLTSTPGWQDQYEIDVYQVGWRAGGKGAAGRNRALGDRIEEHGLHMWFGFYQNAFQMIREVYTELNAKTPYGFASWREAFTPRNDLFLQEYVEGRWESWHTCFAANKELPGDGKPLQSIESMLTEAVEWGIELLLGADLLSWLEHEFEPFEPTSASRSALGRFLDRAEVAIEKRVLGDVAAIGDDLESHLLDARRLAAEAGRSEAGLRALLDLVTPIARWIERALERELDRHTELRRAFILIDLGITILTGLLADGCVAARSFDPIDRYDWMEWLEKNGATRTCLESPWVRGLYDGPFAYVRGDSSRPSMSAAVAVRGQARGFIGYKGAPMWQMNAGMGDTIFAPLYLVLAARGVRFHFFHRVRDLQFDADRTRLTGVTLGVQANVIGGAEYQPLFPLRGIQCWPSTPFYAQLVEGEELAARRVDLESSWADWKDVGEKKLVEGVDFDLVINGISLAAWSDVAKDLFEGPSETSQRWRALRENVPTIPTLAIQLWAEPTMERLGWKAPYGMIGGYAQPFNTWADMSDLLSWESWSGPQAPRSLLYLCGPLREAAVTPPFDAHWFPASQKERVLDAGADWLSANGGHPWPGGAPVNEPASLDPALLHDPLGRVGWERLRAQYVRANVEPTERYVLSPPGTAQYRMRATESGVSNLLIAGDWLSTGLQSGCVEAAVMGGLQASQHVCGYPAVILGDDDTWSAE